MAEAIEPESPPQVDLPRIVRGSRAYNDARWALFAAGFTTFAMLYCVQPLMPVFSHYFAISPATSSLSMSVTTALLAVSMPLAGAISESFGRKGPMAVSLFCAAGLALFTAVAPSWHAVLITRTLEGVALASVPAVAIAYLAEEVEAKDLGATIGLYIGGTAVGGMLGRLMVGVLMDWTGSWRIAIGAMAVLGLIAAIVFVRLLPPSRHFPPSSGIDFGRLAAGFARHLRDPVIPPLCVIGFLIMGSFITIFNYIGYRLKAAPYHLSQSAVGAIFVVYLLGIPVSPWFGGMSGRFGHGVVLSAAILLILAGLVVTLSHPLSLIIAGLALVSAGFFAAHTIASGWVGASAVGAKAQASSLYLLAYYVGSSAAGWFGGRVWQSFGWNGVIGFVALLIGLAFVIAWRLWLATPFQETALNKSPAR